MTIPPIAPSVLIRAARVIDPASGMDQIADVAIADGSIQAIQANLDTSGYDRVINAEGMILSPGLIDPHVHLREPGQVHKEDIESGTLAAVAGGFTAVCCMPNTSPALDSPEMVEFVRSRAEQVGHCRVFSVAAATKGRKGERLAEIGLCLDAGAVGYSDDGDVIESAAMMKAVLQAVKQTGKCFMQHCQELTLTDGAVMHAGTVAAKLGHKGWPREAEEMIIERDIRLNKAIGCDYHIQHMSSGNSVEIVARAQREGMPVTCEASPHHLLLTHEAIETHGTMAKMNPPLREQSDIDALRQGVADGVITILATDHAPHTNDEKRNVLAEAPFGIIGLESALGLYHKALVETGHIDLPKLIELMTINPARLCGLDTQGLGMLKIGGPADITLIDPANNWTLNLDDLAGKSVNTPFLGWNMTIRPMMTIVKGIVRYESKHEQAATVRERS
ncbi:MAG: dihydroorotase [Phycisphaerales bacterium]|nr:dihydroorotase [Phycisphaerales bacterium]